MAVGRKADYTPQIPQLWDKELLFQAEKRTFWNRFEGPEGSGMPVIRKDDLTKEAGDTIKVDLALALVGAGLTGDTDAGLLEGNEEKLKMRQFSFTVDAIRHGVRWSKLAKILINHNMRETALAQLRKWLSGKLDDGIFTEITKTTQPTKNFFFPDPAATTIDGLSTGDSLTLDILTDLKAYAQTELLLEPMRLEDGEEIFGMVVHPYALLPMKKSADYKQAARDARERGKDNPLFTGATLMWDGIVIYTSNRVPRANNAHGTPIPVARNVFFGAQAVVRGYAYYPDWNEQYFSYGEERGVGTFVVKGEKLVVYDFSAAGDGSDNRGIGSILVPSEAQPTGGQV